MNTGEELSDQRPANAIEECSLQRTMHGRFRDALPVGIESCARTCTPTLGPTVYQNGCVHGTG